MHGDDVLLIINPKSSKGKGEQKAKKLGVYFKEKNVKCTIAYTMNAGHAEKLAEAGIANGFKRIVAVGGDGTVNEVLNGIMKSGKSGIKMGIIPVGRGNDIAWMAKIPKNLYKAADLIINGDARDADVGLCVDLGNGGKERYFLNGTGFGFEPLVNFKAMSYKRINGFLSYAVAFLFYAKNPPRGYDVHIVADERTFDLKTQQISVANGIRMGGGFKIAPNAKMDDGVFDLMFPNDVYLGFHLFRLILSFLKGAQVRDKEKFTYINAKHVEIKMKESTIPVHSDGEVVSYNGTSFSLDLIPSGLKLYY